MNEVAFVEGLNNLARVMPTVPFLFIGSGLTRRYYGLPDWKQLLKVFAFRLQEDDFVYAGYENRVKLDFSSDESHLLYPRVAELIEKDFNERWFKDKSFRKLDEHLSYVRDGGSPFKAEVATYIRDKSNLLTNYDDEVSILRSLFDKSISGVVTTNYDCFIESVAEGYKSYIGQEELIFSPIQGIAEIYKMHGCVTRPETILINDKDYKNFQSKSSYLAAKLMTIFLEYPVIFMGYSINDYNIRSILETMLAGLSAKHIEQLKGRLVFVEYTTDAATFDISSHSLQLDKAVLHMTKVTLNDFKILYTALLPQKRTLPVRVLRLFKQDFYSFVRTNTPTEHVIVTIDNDAVSDDKLVMAIGKEKEFALKGLTGITSDQWYRDIIMDDLSFTADQILENSFSRLYPQAQKLPLYKYLSRATKAFPECESKALDFDGIIFSTYKKYRHKMHGQSVESIWNNSNFKLEKKTRLIASLNKEDINVNDLEKILKVMYSQNPEFMSELELQEKSGIRRLIRIYDCLKYKKGS